MAANTKVRAWSLFAVIATMATILVLFAGCRAATDDPVPPSSTTDSGPTATTASTEDTTGDSLVGVELPGNFAQCPDCHSRFDGSVGRDGVLVERFTHVLHLDSGASCPDCHLVPTHREDGIVKPTMAKCFGCHSQDEADAPPGACDACHPPGFELVPVSHGDADWLPAPERLNAVEALHAVDGLGGPEECSVCHDDDFCTDCHKVDMPHPGDWTAAHPATARDVGEGACGNCHPARTLCNECHHTGFEAGDVPWTRQHRNVVTQSGVLPCFQCHNSTTCAHCHTTGEYKAF